LVARKFYKFRHRFPKRLEKLEESYKDRNERDPRGPKCYECSGYGHLCKDCANLISNKPNDKKAFNITMSDTDEEVPDDSPNYVAFGISYDSDDSNQSDDKSTSDNESNRVSELQNSFDNLRKKFSTIRNSNLKLVKDVKNLELEMDNLLKELSDSHAVCNSLKYENHVLIVKNKSLQNDLIETRHHLSTFSSEKLNQMLHAQKRSSDRSGLGFDKTASCSSNHASTSKIVFVKPVEVEKSSGEEKPAVAPTHQGKKGKKNSLVSHASYPKPRVVHPPRKLPSQRFVPTCHHCGKVGHIRPHCFNLKPHVQKNKNSVSWKDCEGLVTMMK
jgi:regulator of replication initiation timing